MGRGAPTWAMTTPICPAGICTIGAKSGVYKPAFGNFEALKTFVEAGGEKGVQRPVLPPGTVAPIHPVGFLVITRERVYGVPIDETIARAAGKAGLTPATFGLQPRQLEVLRIQPAAHEDGKIIDMIGIVTALEGRPLPKGAIANRLGDFEDLAALERDPALKGKDPNPFIVEPIDAPAH